MDDYDRTGIFLRVSRLFPDDGHLFFTLTLVVPPCLRHRRDIADRDSQRRSFLIFENPDFSIHDSTGSSDTCPRTMDGPDLIGKSRIAIPICMSLLFPETPISRPLTLQDLLTCVLHNGQSRSDREIAYRDFNM
jgi:hypothetical protein